MSPVDLSDDETVHRVGTELGLDIEWFLLSTAGVVDRGLCCMRVTAAMLACKLTTMQRRGLVYGSYLREI